MKVTEVTKRKEDTLLYTPGSKTILSTRGCCWLFWVQRLMKCLWQMTDNFAATLYLRPEMFKKKWPPSSLTRLALLRGFSTSQIVKARHSTSPAFIVLSQLTLLITDLRSSPNLEAKYRSIKGKVEGPLPCTQNPSSRPWAEWVQFRNSVIQITKIMFPHKIK
jgi:hypothetical protein